MKILICGNYRQYLSFLRENNLNHLDIINASSSDKIMGLKFKLHNIIFYGTWYERKDLEEIRERIFSNLIDL